MATQLDNKPDDRTNRERLLHAATDAFSEGGYDGVSLRAIADNAGVSFQLIAHYFGNKQDLWRATVQYLFARYMETGKGLGFSSTGDVREQFRNHLRLLLTDMLQRPQLRRIWILEYLAQSDRYRDVIQPEIRHLHEQLSLPYFTAVAQRGIVTRFEPSEMALLWTGIVQANVVYPYFLELLLGKPAGSAESIELQVDLAFRVLTDDGPAAEAVGAEPPDATPLERRLARLEDENVKLRNCVATISIEKQGLLELIKSLRQNELDTTRVATDKETTDDR